MVVDCTKLHTAEVCTQWTFTLAAGTGEYLLFGAGVVLLVGVIGWGLGVLVRLIRMIGSGL